MLQGKLIKTFEEQAQDKLIANFTQRLNQKF